MNFGIRPNDVSDLQGPATVNQIMDSRFAALLWTSGRGSRDTPPVLEDITQTLAKRDGRNPACLPEKPVRVTDDTRHIAWPQSPRILFRSDFVGTQVEKDIQQFPNRYG